MTKTTSYSTYILFIIFICGSFLRFYKLQDAPYWMDEGFTINAVLAIEEHGDQTLDSGNRYTCPLYCYPTAWLSHALGNTPVSYRLVSAISGILFLVVLFLIVRRMFSLRLALLTIFFTSFSYFQIAWSRQARWYTLFELFFWPALYFFYKGYYDPKHRRRSVLLALLFTLLAVLSHGLGYLLPLIFVGWIVIDRIIHKKLSWKLLLPIGIVGLAAFVFLAKRFGIEPSYVLPFYINFYLRSYWLLILLSIIAIVHPGIQTKGAFKKEIHFLLFVLLAYAIPLSFFTDIVNYRYLFHLTPVLFILAAIGFEAIASDLSKRWQKYLILPVLIILFFVSKEGVIIPRAMYFLEADDPTSIFLRNQNSYLFVPQPDWNAAYAFIKENLKSNDQVITTEPPFNKIFLGVPGYWIRYSYNGKTYMPEKDDKEFYVGSKIINDVPELQSLTSSSHGYIVIDYYARNLIPKDITAYIDSTFTKVFYKKTNSYSSISVYRF